MYGEHPRGCVSVKFSCGNRITLVTLMSKGFDTGSWELTKLLEHYPSKLHAGPQERRVEPQQRTGVLRAPSHGSPALRKMPRELYRAR